jgi:hypothetical protein
MPLNCAQVILLRALQQFRRMIEVSGMFNTHVFSVLPENRTGLFFIEFPEFVLQLTK